jgi:hypothetical protein
LSRSRYDGAPLCLQADAVYNSEMSERRQFEIDQENLRWDSAKRTLGLISIWQVLRKLWWEVHLIEEIPKTIDPRRPAGSILDQYDAYIYACINACTTAISLSDWLYHSVKGNPEITNSVREVLGNPGMRDERAFLKALRERYPKINLCHQIANANKHFNLKYSAPYKIDVFEIVERDKGEIIRYTLTLTATDGEIGEKYHMREIMREVANWWEDVLDSIPIPGKADFLEESWKIPPSK